MATTQMSLTGNDLFGWEPQWRLARVQLANWGTFQNLTTLEVDSRGLLVTGPSGSGKSTLLDAIATVLTPPRTRRFNAAARVDGSARDDRSLASYMRGAWRRESDDSGEVTNSYLRPNAATWSGILLTYRSVKVRTEQGAPKSDVAPDEETEPIQLLVLMNLKEGSNESKDVKSLYAIVRGERELISFQRYALNGIDKRAFRKDHPKDLVYDNYQRFAARFRELLGIHSEKTLELLHKTQGAKNFGSLDELFRNFMLDEPEAFSYADRAVEQFRELDEAHAGVVDQRRQMETLEPLVEIDEKVRGLVARQSENRELQDLVEPATTLFIVDFVRASIEKLERALDREEQAVSVAQGRAAREKALLDQAQVMVNQEGGLAIAEAEREVVRVKSRCAEVERNRDALRRELEALGIDAFPASLDEWRLLVRSLAEKALRAQADERDHREENRRVQGLVGALKDKIEDVERELEHLRRQTSNVPKAYDDLRGHLASSLGVEAASLPFVGELLDVKKEYTAWRGAIERLFGRSSLTLLVPQRLTPAVAAYVDERDLKMRFEFVSVPADLEAQPRARDAHLVSARLDVREVAGHPEYGRWVRGHLAKRWDYVCVDSARELRLHSKALTINGQVKQRDRYIKDDRFSVGDRSRWYLGWDNEEKLEGFERDHQRLLNEYEQASKRAEEVEQSQRDVMNLTTAARTLEGRSWESYDVASREEELEAAITRVQLLREGNEELKAAIALRDEAQRAKDDADRQLENARVAAGRTRDELEEQRKLLEEKERAREGDPEVPEAAMERLTSLFRKANDAYDRSIIDIFQTSQAVVRSLGARASRMAAEENRLRIAAAHAMQEYRSSWPVAAADFGAEYEDIEAYLAIYRQIRAAGLPDHELQFLNLLQDFSRDSITRLAAAIHDAPGEIANKLEPVNESLTRSPYAPGTHLWIQMQPSRGRVAQQFLADLNAITSGDFNQGTMEESEPRFVRATSIIRRLGSSDPEDRRWRRQCLDTRQHVRFIARELNDDGETVRVYESDAGLSGGQKQKLVIFCLAAALRYQLADESRFLPSYATVILDEAFDKADFRFASSALEILQAFGFHLLLATPLRHLSVIEEHVGSIVLVDCEDSQRSTLHPVAFEDVQDEGSSDAEREG